VARGAVCTASPGARCAARVWEPASAQRRSPAPAPALLAHHSTPSPCPLQDGTAKMSKSSENDLSRINLTDDAATIANKIKRCKTDAAEGLLFDDPERPECCNLLQIYQICTGKTKVRPARRQAASPPAAWSRASRLPAGSRGGPGPQRASSAPAARQQRASSAPAARQQRASSAGCAPGRRGRRSGCRALLSLLRRAFC
jgi:hypothetical protein